MQQVIGELLPLALGIAISPIPIIAIILMLITPKARSNGLAFLLGWMAGILIVGGIALVVADVAGLSTGSEAASQSQAVIKLVLGLLLLVVAARQWRSRPKPGEEASLPKWMQTLDTFTPVKSFGLARAALWAKPEEPGAQLGSYVDCGDSRTLHRQSGGGLAVRRSHREPHYHRAAGGLLRGWREVR